MTTTAFTKRYATNKQAEREGVEVDFGDGMFVTLVRMNHPDAKKLRRKLEKPYARMTEIPDDVQEGILNQVMAQVIVRGWRGVDLGNGEVPYSADNVADVFKRFSDFRDDVATAALTRETFKTEDDEAAAKN